MVRKNIARHQSGQTCSSRNGLQCNGLVRAELAAGKVAGASRHRNTMPVAHPKWRQQPRSRRCMSAGHLASQTCTKESCTLAGTPERRTASYSPAWLLRCKLSDRRCNFPPRRTCQDRAEPMHLLANRTNPLLQTHRNRNPQPEKGLPKALMAAFRFPRTPLLSVCSKYLGKGGGEGGGRGGGGGGWVSG